MTQQIVIKDGIVIATHAVEQNIAAEYPGCEIVLWSGSPVMPFEGDYPTKDPRTNEQRITDVNLASQQSVLSRHLAEAEQGVILVNGWRMRYVREAIDGYIEAKTLIDLSPSIPEIAILDADGILHRMAVEELRLILTEYSSLVATEKMRQMAELAPLA